MIPEEKVLRDVKSNFLRQFIFFLFDILVITNGCNRNCNKKSACPYSSGNDTAGHMYEEPTWRISGWSRDNSEEVCEEGQRVESVV
jgi:hypothetical protein